MGYGLIDGDEKGASAWRRQGCQGAAIAARGHIVCAVRAGPLHVGVCLRYGSPPVYGEKVPSIPFSESDCPR